MVVQGSDNPSTTQPPVDTPPPEPQGGSDNPSTTQPPVDTPPPEPQGGSASDKPNVSAEDLVNQTTKLREEQAQLKKEYDAKESLLKEREAQVAQQLDAVYNITVGKLDADKQQMISRVAKAAGIDEKNKQAMLDIYNEMQASGVFTPAPPAAGAVNTNRAGNEPPPPERITSLAAARSRFKQLGQNRT